MSTLSNTPATSTDPSLADRYQQVRAFTNKLCETLGPEDCCLQSMPDASPVRWHLAHTSWFFETFLLKQDPQYQVFDQQYEVLFNSYYNSVGEQFPRAQRGLLSRPTLEEVLEYRQYVDRHLAASLERISDDAKLAQIVEIGLHHEQQHQELILTDLKHLFSLNPLLPTYREASKSKQPATVPAQQWLEFDEGLYAVGHEGNGFSFDNESPRHRVFLEPFAIAGRPVASSEYLEFIADGGYTRPELWLSLGWHFVNELKHHQPMYWYECDEGWQEFTLAGLRKLDPSAPVTHISFFEADAYARWAGCRLPTEAEWEAAAEGLALTGNFADTLLVEKWPLHPTSRTILPPSGESLEEREDTRPHGMFGDCWEWTASPYTPYPGYQAVEGALGEYNGKFMCNQYVLRGGSVATSSNHIRPTYRNFFPPEARWQFSGIRLAKSC